MNQVIIEELSERVAKPSENLADALSWFIGSGMDDETYNALKEIDAEGKKLAAREM